MIKLTKYEDKSLVIVNEKAISYLSKWNENITTIYFGENYIEVIETVDEVLKLIEEHDNKVQPKGFYSDSITRKY